MSSVVEVKAQRRVRGNFFTLSAGGQAATAASHARGV
jgi:hypothetical protein